MDIKKIKNQIRRWWIKRKLIRKYEGDLIIATILETWITKRILEGQTKRRGELNKKRGEIEEIKLFLEFLKKI
jgi:hypothetical protein